MLVFYTNLQTNCDRIKFKSDDRLNDEEDGWKEAEDCDIRKAMKDQD